jgi:hypothetical protein
MNSQPDFTVAVEGAFDEAGVWIIDTKVTFRDDLTFEQRDALVGQGRLALLVGIAREAARGRSLGADRVRVHLDHMTRAGLGDLPAGLETVQ